MLNKGLDVKTKKISAIRSLSWEEVEAYTSKLVGAIEYDKVIRSVAAADLNSIIPAILIANKLGAQFAGYGKLHEQHIVFGLIGSLKTDVCFFKYKFEDVVKDHFDIPYFIEEIEVELDRDPQKIKYPWGETR